MDKKNAAAIFVDAQCNPQDFWRWFVTVDKTFFFVPTRGGIKRFLTRSTQTVKSAQDAGPRVQAPMRFLLALVVAVLCTPIELPRLHHHGDEWLDKHPYLFRLEHKRDHCVRSELCAHCPTDSLPFRAPPGTDKECVLCMFHKRSAVATRLIVSFLGALQVGIKATMAWNRLRQVKADLTVLSIQPGGELWD